MSVVYPLQLLLPSRCVEDEPALIQQNNPVSTFSTQLSTSSTADPPVKWNNDLSFAENLLKMRLTSLNDARFANSEGWGSNGPQVQFLSAISSSPQFRVISVGTSASEDGIGSFDKVRVCFTSAIVGSLLMRPWKIVRVEELLLQSMLPKKIAQRMKQMIRSLLLLKPSWKRWDGDLCSRGSSDLWKIASSSCLRSTGDITTLHSTLCWKTMQSVCCYLGVVDRSAKIGQKQIRKVSVDWANNKRAFSFWPASLCRLPSQSISLDVLYYYWILESEADHTESRCGLMLILAILFWLEL